MAAVEAAMMTNNFELKSSRLFMEDEEKRLCEHELDRDSRNQETVCVKEESRMQCKENGAMYCKLTPSVGIGSITDCLELEPGDALSSNVSSCYSASDDSMEGLSGGVPFYTSADMSLMGSRMKNCWSGTPKPMEPKPLLIWKNGLSCYGREDRSSDVKEVDLVEINKMSRFRSLIKNVDVPPIFSRFKVYIVDDCHLLQGETWVALRDKMEELPPHVVFIANGVISDAELLDLLNLALSSDASNTIKKVRELIASRIDPLQLISQLASLITDILAGKCDGEIDRKLFGLKNVSGAELEQLRHALKILYETDKQLRTSKDQTMWLTVALLQLSSAGASHDEDAPRLSSKVLHAQEGESHRMSTDEFWKHPVTSSCENATQYEVETLELIWIRATRICESSSVKNFLQKRGKLVSVRLIQGNLNVIHFTHCLEFTQVSTLECSKMAHHIVPVHALRISGVAVADLEFDHPDHVSRAEKSWKVIAGVLQRILGYNVELRINLANSASKLKKPTLNLFSCSRRVHLQSHFCAECGSSASEYSIHTPTAFLTRDRYLQTRSLDREPQILHTCCHGSEVVSSIRNSDGNALSIGIRTPHKSVVDSMGREVPPDADTFCNGIENLAYIKRETRSRYTAPWKKRVVEAVLLENRHISFSKDDIRSLIPRGFEVIGALVVHDKDGTKAEKVAGDAISAVGSFRKAQYGNDREDPVLIGAVLDLNSSSSERDLHFFVPSYLNPEPYAQAITAAERKLRDPQVAYIIETQDRPSSGGPQPVILHGFELDPAAEDLPENAVNAVILESDEDSFAKSPLGEAKLLVDNHKLEVLSYCTKDLRLTDIISKLIIPGLVDQLHSLKSKILPDLLTQQLQLRSYHFMPPGFLHPITVIRAQLWGDRNEAR
ncbi:hypothetical protein SASPL_131865 [Salvia splendens]|uniref:STICHEL DnaA-N-like alpha-beta domain-containing protein n=1 Tax=Salvia splendens TaxID=180675 RepID=A0A8X8X6N3_SALSN|nr:hypothetical protein SASPL_131865 [Salvia splendens]